MLSAVGKRVGVLGLQGDYARHLELLEGLDMPAALVRTPSELEAVDALIIPGGESTTIGKLMVRSGLLALVRQHAEAGMPVFGTCAGAILLAREVLGVQQDGLGIMDLTIERNAYGRQVASTRTVGPVRARTASRTPLRNESRVRVSGGMSAEDAPVFGPTLDARSTPLVAVVARASRPARLPCAVRSSSGESSAMSRRSEAAPLAAIPRTPGASE